MGRKNLFRIIFKNGGLDKMEVDIENILCIAGIITIAVIALYMGVTENAIVIAGISLIGGYLAKSLQGTSTVSA
jgi:hypothetical protein